MLADVALDDDAEDKLGFKPFADAIAGIIDSPRTSTPLVMAINAKWGAGKTTLGQMIKRRLETKSAADGHAPHVTCWFPAWMHDDAPILSTALATEIAQVASRARPAWRRIAGPLPSSLATARQRKLRKGMKYFSVLIMGVLACTFVSLRFGHSLPEVAKLDPAVVKSLTTLTGGAYLTALALATYLVFHAVAALWPMAKSVSEFARDPQSAAKTASMHEVRNQLGKLIRQATPKGSKFVIFVDDLDRCRPPRSVDVLEAINQLLDHTGVVVVLMSDMQVVAKCAEIKYRDLATLEVPAATNHTTPAFSTYGWSFLQKIIQLQFDIPMCPVRAIRQMIVDLARDVPEEKLLGRLDAVRNLWVKCRRKVASVRSRTALEVAVSAVVILAMVVVTARLFGFPPELSSSAVLKWRSRQMLIDYLLFGISLAVGAWFTYVLPRIASSRRESKRRREIDDQIRARISAGERDFSRIEAHVRRESSAWLDDAQTEGLVRERLQRYLEDESEIQREAEDEVMRHVEPMPRHAKRLLNRLRLLLFIAHERKMFGGKPKLSSRHIGKWAVLGERWPQLLQLVSTNPNIMTRLEAPEAYDVTINENAPIYQNDKALRRFCLSRVGIKLSPVARRIVEFAPSKTEKTNP